MIITGGRWDKNFGSLIQSKQITQKYRYLQPHDGGCVIEIDSEAKWFGNALDHCRPLKHHLAGSPAALSRIAKRQKNWPNSSQKIAKHLTILGHKEVAQVDLSSAGYHAPQQVHNPCFLHSVTLHYV